MEHQPAADTGREANIENRQTNLKQRKKSRERRSNSIAHQNEAMSEQGEAQDIKISSSKHVLSTLQPNCEFVWRF